MGKELHSIDDRAHCYAFSVKTNIVSSNTIITGTIDVCDRMDFLLFDLRSIYSYVSIHFVVGLNLVCGVSAIIFVCLLSWLVCGSNLCLSLLFYVVCGFSDLGIFNYFRYVGHYVILGMAWLSPCHIFLNCDAKIVILAMPGMDQL